MIGHVSTGGDAVAAAAFGSDASSSSSCPRLSSAVLVCTLASHTHTATSAHIAVCVLLWQLSLQRKAMFSIMCKRLLNSLAAAAAATVGCIVAALAPWFVLHVTCCIGKRCAQHVSTVTPLASTSSQYQLILCMYMHAYTYV
jgi:hypothetical protein